jgi:DNA-directed RNA polymerase subunit RPC12/RpoP
MSVPFRCSHCNQELLADDAEVGMRIHCPACGAQILVPGQRRTVSFLSPGNDDPLPANAAGRSDRSQKANEKRQLAEYLQKNNIVDTKYASRRVRIPGICLIIAAFLGFVVNALYLLEHSFHLGVLNVDAARARMAGRVPEWLISGWLPVVMSAVAVGVCVVILLGSIQMLYLEKYWLAYTAAILAAIPCFTSCCCMPIGIWAVVVLSDSAVKLAFQVRQETGGG